MNELIKLAVDISERLGFTLILKGPLFVLSGDERLL
jgi:hypothetical protein